MGLDVSASVSVLALSQEMFQKIVDYVGGELASTTDDYALLQKLNEVTADEYVKMTDTATNLNTDMGKLRKKCASLTSPSHLHPIRAHGAAVLPQVMPPPPSSLSHTYLR
jgi:hypothetical protein